MIWEGWHTSCEQLMYDLEQAKKSIPFASGTVYQSIDSITSDTPLSENFVCHPLVNGLKSS